MSSPINVHAQQVVDAFALPRAKGGTGKMVVAQVRLEVNAADNIFFSDATDTRNREAFTCFDHIVPVLRALVERAQHEAAAAQSAVPEPTGHASDHE